MVFYHAFSENARLFSFFLERKANFYAFRRKNRFFPKPPAPDLCPSGRFRGENDVIRCGSSRNVGRAMQAPTSGRIPCVGQDTVRRAVSRPCGCRISTEKCVAPPTCAALSPDGDVQDLVNDPVTIFGGIDMGGDEAGAETAQHLRFGQGKIGQFACVDL